MENKKYELTNYTIKRDGKTLHRIKALRDIIIETQGLNTTIKKGRLGGYIESENNLSQSGNCWVGDTAKIYGNAIVRDNAYVGGNTEVYDNAGVLDEAVVDGNNIIHNNTVVTGHAYIRENVHLCGSATVGDDVMLWGIIEVSGHTDLRGNLSIVDDTKISKTNHAIGIGPLPSLHGKNYNNYISFYKCGDGINVYTGHFDPTLHNHTYDIDEFKVIIDKIGSTDECFKEVYHKAIDLAKIIIEN